MEALSSPDVFIVRPQAEVQYRPSRHLTASVQMTSGRILRRAILKNLDELIVATKKHNEELDRLAAKFDL